jgi:hypothetical protein
MASFGYDWLRLALAEIKIETNRNRLEKVVELSMNKYG